MRRRLSQAMRLEKEGASLKYPEYPYTFEQDYGEVKKKLDALVHIVAQFRHGRSSNETMKLQTRFNHILGRLENMICDDEDKRSKKSELLATALSLMELLDEKVQEFEKREIVSVPASLSLLEGQTGAATFHRDIETASRSSSVVGDGRARASADAPEHDVRKTFPLYKWDLQKFSGDKRGMSISAFLEKVEELRVA